MLEVKIIGVGHDSPKVIDASLTKCISVLWCCTKKKKKEAKKPAQETGQAQCGADSY